MLFVYRALINLVLLFSPFIIFVRLLKKKEDTKRFKEKFCFFSKKRSKGQIIWFHGASVGEILSVIPIIEKLEKNTEINQILVTSNTLSSSKILSKYKFKKTIHQFFPIDTNYHTQKFINYWKPSIAVFIDSEIWPNMIINIKKKKISLILLNARITKKSFKRWRTLISISQNLFQKFDLCLPSSKESLKYLKFLGVKKIKHIGNLKFSQSELTEKTISKNLKKFFKYKKIWCASSTHKNEEKICAIVHKKLKAKYKNLITVIIPRHITRSNSIINEINDLNLKVYTHSSQKKISNDTDIYLVNTYGETKSFFKICKTVFLGGSIVEHGGQNPLEAIRYGCQVLHGNNISNFKEIYNLLNKNSASTQINNVNQMADKVDGLLEKNINPKIIKSKIKKLGDKILNLTLKEINLVLKNNENSKA